MSEEHLLSHKEPLSHGLEHETKAHEVGAPRLSLTTVGEPMPPLSQGMAPTTNHPFSPDNIFSTVHQAREDHTEQPVDQGHYQNCWLEAPAAAMARTAQGRQLLSNMITQSTDGNYQVNFPGQSLHSYVVSQADMDRLNIKDHATWAAVIDTAGLQHFPGLITAKSDLNVNPKETDIAVGLKTLTGIQPKNIDIPDNSLTQLSNVLQQNLKNGFPVVAGTYSQADESPAMVHNHAYAVTSFDPATNMVTVLNPWGKDNPSHKFPGLPAAGQDKDGVHDLGNGVLQMSLATFSKDFHKLYWSPLPSNPIPNPAIVVPPINLAISGAHPAVGDPPPIHLEPPDPTQWHFTVNGENRSTAVGVALTIPLVNFQKE